MEEIGRRYWRGRAEHTYIMIVIPIPILIPLSQEISPVRVFDQRHHPPRALGRASMIFAVWVRRVGGRGDWRAGRTLPGGVDERWDKMGGEGKEGEGEGEEKGAIPARNVGCTLGYSLVLEDLLGGRRVSWALRGG